MWLSLKLFLYRVDHTLPDKGCNGSYKARIAVNLFDYPCIKVLERDRTIGTMVERLSLVNRLGDHSLYEQEEGNFLVFGGCSVARVKDVTDGLIDQILRHASHVLSLSALSG